MNMFTAVASPSRLLAGVSLAAQQPVVIGG